MDVFLLIYSILFIIIMMGVVLIPFLRKQSELFTFNNLFCAGSAVFVGLSGINAVVSGHYFQYDGYTYIRFFLSTTLFYLAYFFSYTRWRRAGIAGHKFGLQMPVWKPIGLTVFYLCLLPLLIVPAVAPNIPGIGRLWVQLGFIAPGFIVASALWAWYRSKINPFIIGSSLIAIAVAIITLFSEGGGRRALYGAMFGLPIAYYWLSMRSWRRAYVVITICFVLIFGMAFDLTYNRVRWIGTSRSSVEIGGADDRLRMLTDSFDWRNFTGVIGMGQTGVEYSLMAIHFYSSSERFLPLAPLHSLYVLLTFPIPRAFWNDKPEHLGLTLPFDARIFKVGTKTNAGPGIAGHLAQDGGMLLAIPYAILLAWALRYLDGILHARGDDPLVLGFMSASGFHILGWSRGDISSFTIWPLLCFLFMLVAKQCALLSGLAVRQRAVPITPQSRMPSRASPMHKVGSDRIGSRSFSSRLE